MGYGSKKYPTKVTNLVYSSEGIEGGYKAWGIGLKYDSSYLYNFGSFPYANGAEGYYLIQIKAKSGTISTYKFKLTQTKKFKNSRLGKSSKSYRKEQLSRFKITKGTNK